MARPCYYSVAHNWNASNSLVLGFSAFRDKIFVFMGKNAGFSGFYYIANSA